MHTIPAPAPASNPTKPDESPPSPSSDGVPRVSVAIRWVLGAGEGDVSMPCTFGDGASVENDVGVGADDVGDGVGTDVVGGEGLLEVGAVGASVGRNT